MTSEIPAAYRELQSNFNEAIAVLEAATQNVSSAAIAINTGATKVTAAADRISARTERQAANLEETNASLGEITHVTKQSAKGAASGGNGDSLLNHRSAMQNVSSVSQSPLTDRAAVSPDCARSSARHRSLQSECARRPPSVLISLRLHSIARRAASSAASSSSPE